jgi:hypothetical protein
MPSLTGIKHRLHSALYFGRYDHRAVFSRIFRDRGWGDEESVSGIGSRMAQTENIRRELPRILREYHVKRLFDAPCGDLNWMKSVLVETNVQYTGGDIVPDVVELARHNSPEPAYTFTVFDITSDPFPTADLWVCRDVLFHLSFANIWKALQNFCRSEIKMMLVTTHTAEEVVNRDIWTGDFRLLDLFKPPFSLPRSIVLDRFPDYAEPLPQRDMVLLRREDLEQHLKSRRSGQVVISR